MKIETEAGSAEEQPARDISSGDEVIRLKSSSGSPEFFYNYFRALHA